MKKNWYKVILLGAVWGIFEATVGYLLHFWGIKIGSMIWFPIAYYFTHRAYRYTGSYSAALLTACIAAALKLINLFFPGRIDMVLNPAVSIILEALAVVLVYKYAVRGQLDQVNPLTVALTGFLWRGLYVCYLFLMPRAVFDISSLTALDSFLEFMFVKNAINIAIISAGFYAASVFAKGLTPVSDGLRALAAHKTIAPLAVAGSMVLAVIAQVLLR